MKNAFPILVGCFLIACSSATRKDQPIISDESGYDSLLAKKLGADDYGMRRYVMAFLKEGPNRGQDSLTAATLQRAHLDNITRMAEEGLLVVAGPFIDDFETKGIYIFAVESVEEAEELASTDPAIQEGRLTLELHPWYGSAALIQVNDAHTRIAKTGI